MSDIVFLLLTAVVLIVMLSQSIFIVDENTRVAVFLMGRFESFRGPGLLFLAPFVHRVQRLTLGETGVVSGAGFVRFGDTDVPAGNVEAFRQGDSVRIDGFDGAEPRLVAAEPPSSVQSTCPRCGHKF